MRDSFVFRVPSTKLLIGLLVTLVPISIAGLYSITTTESALGRAIGTNFKTISEGTADEVSLVIHDLVRNVGSMAVESSVLDRIASANRGYQGMSESAISDRISGIDKGWNSGQAESQVREILECAASRQLRRYRELDPRILRITATDVRGATVAATHKSLDYYQADEEYWQNIYAQGRGALVVTDILFDEVTKSYYIGIGVPVMESGSNRFLGTVDVLADISLVFPIINRVQLGATGRAMLVKDDGTVIASPHGTLAMKLKSEEYAAVDDALGTVQGRETGFLVADLTNVGRTVIGFADTGLRRDYGNLGWIVLVRQSTREAFAPIATVTRLIAFLSLLGIAMVTLLAVYISLHRRQRFEEIGELRREAEATQGKV